MFCTGLRHDQNPLNPMTWHEYHKNSNCLTSSTNKWSRIFEILRSVLEHSYFLKTLYCAMLCVQYFTFFLFRINFKLIFKLNLVIGGWEILCAILLRWRSLDFDNSLVYNSSDTGLGQSWLNTMSPFGLNMPQWHFSVNSGIPPQISTNWLSPIWRNFMPMLSREMYCRMWASIMKGQIKLIPNNCRSLQECHICRWYIIFLLLFLSR